MLARRLRRRPNIDPALVHCLVFAGKGMVDVEPTTDQYGWCLTHTVRESTLVADSDAMT